MIFLEEFVTMSDNLDYTIISNEKVKLSYSDFYNDDLGLTLPFPIEKEEIRSALYLENAATLERMRKKIHYQEILVKSKKIRIVVNENQKKSYAFLKNLCKTSSLAEAITFIGLDPKNEALKKNVRGTSSKELLKKDKTTLKNKRYKLIDDAIYATLNLTTEDVIFNVMDIFNRFWTKAEFDKIEFKSYSFKNYIDRIIQREIDYIDIDESLFDFNGLGNPGSIKYRKRIFKIAFLIRDVMDSNRLDSILDYSGYQRINFKDYNELMWSLCLDCKLSFDEANNIIEKFKLYKNGFLLSHEKESFDKNTNNYACSEYENYCKLLSRFKAFLSESESNDKQYDILLNELFSYYLFDEYLHYDDNEMIHNSEYTAFNIYQNLIEDVKNIIFKTEAIIENGKEIKIKNKITNESHLVEKDIQLWKNHISIPDICLYIYGGKNPLDGKMKDLFENKNCINYMNDNKVKKKSSKNQEYQDFDIRRSYITTLLFVKYCFDGSNMSFEDYSNPILDEARFGSISPKYALDSLFMFCIIQSKKNGTSALEMFHEFCFEAPISIITSSTT
jgi:hypothetical protein